MQKQGPHSRRPYSGGQWHRRDYRFNKEIAGHPHRKAEPDEKTFAYIKGREFAPADEDWEQALSYWKSIVSDEGAEYDKTVILAAEDIAPQVTWGTSPEQVTGVDSIVPAPDSFDNTIQNQACKNALAYMNLEAGTKITDINKDSINFLTGLFEDFIFDIIRPETASDDNNRFAVCLKSIKKFPHAVSE